MFPTPNSQRLVMSQFLTGLGLLVSVPLMLRSVLLIVAVPALLSCGPIGYVYNVTNRAASGVKAAESAGAKRLAPYEYWSAVTYLRMAREKAGRADFQIAIRYGKRATKMSQAAQQICRRAAAPPGRETTSAVQNGKRHVDISQSSGDRGGGDQE